MYNTMSYLYVEDDPLSAEVMQIMMRDVLSVARLTVFEDSTDFHERVHALPELPDMFLLDIHMKPINGFEMLKLIRADEYLRDAIVVALTASVMNEEVAQLRSSGFDGAIAKPLDLNKFPDLLLRVIQGDSVWSIT